MDAENNGLSQLRKGKSGNYMSKPLFCTMTFLQRITSQKEHTVVESRNEPQDLPQRVGGSTGFVGHTASSDGNKGKSKLLN